MALSLLSTTRGETMQGVQVLLPKRAWGYAKAIVALALAVATSLSGVLSAPDWLTILVAVLTPVAVYLQANGPSVESDETAHE